MLEPAPAEVCLAVLRRAQSAGFQLLEDCVFEICRLLKNTFPESCITLKARTAEVDGFVKNATAELNAVFKPNPTEIYWFLKLKTAKRERLRHCLILDTLTEVFSVDRAGNW
ncbi:MAG TPA: hypothetical protein VKB49_20610 [Candidatus Sulfotelmatobacter sp.]|nr:hypothetical protein [Candidatus Sulfotelmatobacter sp.]